jgi:opacity protein-like surface antigen
MIARVFAAALVTAAAVGFAAPAQAVPACIDPLAYHLFGAHQYGAGWAENSRVWASDSLNCKYRGDYYIWVAGDGTRYQGKIDFVLRRGSS